MIATAILTSKALTENAHVERLIPAAQRRPNERANGKADKIETPGSRVYSSSEFISGFIPPEFFVGNILQRGFLYSYTGATGGGKTTLALRLSASVALGVLFAGQEVSKGRVLYLVGENPDDVRARWIALGEEIGADLAAVEVFFMPGIFHIGDSMPVMERAAHDAGGFDLVIVDTSAAYYQGDEENNNVEIGKHARMLRELTRLPGRPCVLACCHPTKNATSDNLVPRGGGAFLAEVDGNLTCKRNDTTMELHHFGKLRGPGFEPMFFELLTVHTPRLVDSKGQTIPTVIARGLSDTEQRTRESVARGDEDTLLLAMLAKNGGSIADLAKEAGWMLTTGHPYKSKVMRILDRLQKDKLVSSKRGCWALTTTGETEAKRAKSQPQNVTG
jgi:hypothetical protein